MFRDNFFEVYRIPISESMSFEYYEVYSFASGVTSCMLMVQPVGRNVGRESLKGYPEVSSQSITVDKHQRRVSHRL